MKQIGSWIGSVVLVAVVLGVCAGATTALATAPTANNQSASAAQGDIRRGLSLDVDPLYTENFFTIVTMPQHGTLEYRDASGVWHVYAAGTAVSYAGNFGPYFTPAAGYLGGDSFTWKATFRGEDSNLATFSISVVENTAPVADNSAATIQEGKIRVGVSPQYTDPDTGQPFSFSLVAGPAHGSVQLYDSATATYTTIAVGTPVQSTSWRYCPATGYVGLDSFTWRMSDGLANSNIATVSITVTPNTPPVAYDQKMIAVANHVAISNSQVKLFYGDPDGQVMTYQILTPPAHGTAASADVRGIVRYTAAAGYTGTDSFTWRVSDGMAWSAPATCRIKVRNLCDRSGLHVLLVVKSTLLPEISAEVNRLKADVEAEGYTAKIASFSGTSDLNLWDFLKTEYDTPNQFMAGAILIGNLPICRGSYAGDLCFWDMQRGKELILATGYVVGLKDDSRHIWISRFYASGSETAKYGNEVVLLKRALQANHDYRTGASRLPPKVWYYDQIHGNDRSGAYLATGVWPLAGRAESPMAAFLAGGELLDETSHGTASSYGSVSAATLHQNIAQVRFALCTSCMSGPIGGVVNNQILTRDGGNIMSVAGTGVVVEGDYTFVDHTLGTYEMALAGLNAGETWGDSLAARIYMGSPPFNNYSHSSVFHGDLSVRIKATPPNAMPALTAFTADKTAGNAPLTVNFSATASDSDGSIAKYEWFIAGFDSGRRDPEYTTTVGVATHTFPLAHRYQPRLQVFDNYKALAWKELDILVAPTPGEPVRVNCGRNLTYYLPGADYTDAATNLWLHDQGFVTGTWGYSGGNQDSVAQAVAGTTDDALYQAFRTGASFSYKIPVLNGAYWLRLKLADMKSTGAGQRVLDVAVEGLPQVSGLDVYATAGSKTAMAVELYAQVSDGELTITVSRNAAATADAFLNGFEVVPYSSGNRLPVAQGQSVSTPENIPLAITLGASDPDGDALTYSIVGAPAHGTLSGTPPNVTYTPHAGYTGADQFTFRANDGTAEGNLGAVSVLMTGLVLHWALDEGSGTSLTDLSGKGNTGALTGGPAWMEGQTGGALSFDGTNDYAQASDSASLDAPRLTVASWLNCSANFNNAYVNKENAYMVGIDSDGTLKASLYTSASWTWVDSGVPVPKNVWTHTAVTYDGTSIRYYTNGVLAATKAHPNGGNVQNTTHPLRLAARGTSTVGSFVPVKLDDVRIYVGALSDAQVLDLATGTAPDFDSDGIPDAADPDDDNDGMSDVDEAVAGTDPFDPEARFQVSGFRFQGGESCVVFDSVNGRVYGVYYRDDLLQGQWLPLNTNISGTGSPILFTDSAAGARRFYRLKVRLP